MRLPFFLRRTAQDSGADEEQRLVQAARRQDRAAFDSLVYAHKDRLRAFLLRRVGAEAADDIMQETFVAAWQAVPRLNLRVRFKTWLFSIAVHKAADHHRSQGRRSEVEAPLDPEWLPSVPAPGDDFKDAEQRATVRTLLDGLNDDQRQLLEMYYFAELTLPEIATVLNRNLNTVKYQFYRAHAVAAQRMEGLESGSLASPVSKLEAVRNGGGISPAAYSPVEGAACTKKVVLEG